jgi:hypothetical protein
MADDPDYVKVLDFGIAKVMAPEMPGLTRGDLVCGTPQYMSPEQATGAPVDGRSDLYAVGVVLYRMVTGFLPFEGRNPMEFLTKHASEIPMRPSLRRPDAKISPELEALIMKALEKDPAARPQTAEDFRRELLAIEAVRRVEMTGTVVNASKLGNRSGQAMANAPTQAPSPMTAMLEPDAPTSIGMEVHTPLETSAAHTRVSMETSSDLTNAVVAYRRAQRTLLLRKIAMASIAAIVLGGAAYFFYPQIPDDWQAKPKELYDVVAAKVAELLHKNELDTDRHPRSSHPGRTRTAHAGEPKAVAAPAEPDEDSPEAKPDTVVAAAPAAAKRCAEGTVEIARGGDVFCIDKYEYPNQVGVAPAVWQDWATASQSCKARGRRLCSAEEWALACRGPKGQERSVTGSPASNAEDCNSADAKGVRRKIDPSGHHKLCVSGFGVVDMSGNAAEWTASVSPDNSEQRLVKGGSAADAAAKQGCDSEARQLAGTPSDLIGFRCCSEPGE